MRRGSAPHVRREDARLRELGVCLSVLVFVVGRSYS